VGRSLPSSSADGGTAVIGRVVAVGLVDEITDRQYVIVDGADGRVHYAELGRLRPDDYSPPLGALQREKTFGPARAANQ
jgi:type IV secretory pathway VirD2 relaxase